MATFSKKATAQKQITGRTYEGEVTFETSPEVDLFSAAITTLDPRADFFYEKSGFNTLFSGEVGGRLGRVFQLMKVANPIFVAKLIVYLTEIVNLRTIPIIMAVELAHDERLKGTGLLRALFSRIIRRPDQIVETLSYFAERNRKNWKSRGTQTAKLLGLPRPIKRGLADAFTKFDEYQLSKYNRPTEIKLRDALFVLYPKAKNVEQKELFDRLAQDELQTADTWEVRKSQAGQTGESSRQVWEDMIDSQKLGYMAALRNLRNMLNDGISDEHLKKVLSYLSNTNAIRNSKQFPYRFLSAYRELATPEETEYNHYYSNRQKRITPDFRTSEVLSVLEECALKSVSNLDFFNPEDRVLVSVDVSGSMENAVSNKSTVTRKDIGLLMGMLSHSFCKKSIVSVFGDRFRVLTFNKNTPLSNCLSGSDDNFGVGHATNGHLVVDYLLKNNVVLDKVIIVTDEQFWERHPYLHSIRDFTYSGGINELWTQYRAKINNNAQLYLIDVAGYGKTPVSADPRTGTYKLSGWSDAAFSLMSQLAKGSSIFDEVMKVEL